MKTNVLHVFLLAASLAIIGCDKKGEDGDPGSDGKTTLVRTSVEAASTNCASGGAKIEVGLDANNNGTLEASEVNTSQTKYICNGTIGTNGTNGQNSLTKTTVETAGANCATGGVKVEVGIDVNNNGTLEATEVLTAMTRYLCNGSNGLNGLTSLIRTSAEPAGSNCTNGGMKFETGLDANKNGALEDGEVTASQTKYVCNGVGNGNGAQVLYSDWIDVNLQVIVIEVIQADEIMYDYKQTLAAPKLTAEIANKGVVLMYYKNREGAIVPIGSNPNGSVADTYDFDGNGTLQYFPIPVGFSYKAGEVKFLVKEDGHGLAAYNGTTASIRYVLIPGTMLGRTVDDLRKMSYEEIAKLYAIKK